MSGKTEITAVPGERTLTVTRTYDAPRELVWDMFSKPENLSRWYGPRWMAMPVLEMDFRVGGAYHFVHQDGGGKEYPFRGEYKEIQAPERLVQTFIFDVAPFNEHASLETARFEEVDGQTLVTMTSEYVSGEIRDAAMCDQMEAGMKDTMDRLGELLDEKQGRSVPPSEPNDPNTTFFESESEPSVTMVRVFNAPAQAIFEASSQPELMKQWWGPSCFKLDVTELDFRVGGKYHFLQSDQFGNVFPFKGEYREIEAPNRIVHTQIFDIEPFNADAALVTVTTEEQDGKTKLSSTITFPSFEARTDACESGMKFGMAESLNRLAQLVERN